MELQYNGKDCERMGDPGGPGYKWSIAAATMFAVTIITTVGELESGQVGVGEKWSWGRMWDPSGPGYKWSITTATMFAVTIITTVGELDWG